jgi:hypothetical protein
MYRYRLIYSFISLAALVLGLFFAFWPLALFGLLLAAATGQYAVAVLIGLCMDVLYGAPVGPLHFISVPFTIVALLLSVPRYYLSAYFREGDTGRL